MKSADAIQQLEQAAIDAHFAGQSFSGFWEEHSGEIAQVGKKCRVNFGNLYCRLMHLVLSGEIAGMVPIGEDAEPLMIDAAAPLGDVGTKARWQGSH